MKQNRPTYIAQTLPGFEIIAADEILRRLEGAKIRGTRTIADKNGMVIFDYGADVRDLLTLRTVEDVFALIGTVRDLPPTYGGLRQLRELVQKLPIEPAVLLARQVKPGRGGHGKLRFRVVARQIGRMSYRRIEAQEMVEKAILARTDRRWQKSEESALEFWLTLLPDEALLALRLSDERMRHRDDQKREHLPAALRPSAAAALVWLTRPAPDDVFLDPMCGTGTVLIERAHTGRYELILGGDVREEAVAATLANIGSRYKPIEVRQWDARALPLDQGSVGPVAVNLPFGQQLGNVAGNRALYPAFLGEMARVLRPKARLVTLTGDMRTFEDAFRRAAGFTPHEAYPVHVLGQRAKIYVMERS